MAFPAFFFTPLLSDSCLSSCTSLWPPERSPPLDVICTEVLCRCEPLCIIFPCRMASPSSPFGPHGACRPSSLVADIRPTYHHAPRSSRMCFGSTSRQRWPSSNARGKHCSCVSSTRFFSCFFSQDAASTCLPPHGAGACKSGGIVIRAEAMLDLYLVLHVVRHLPPVKDELMVCTISHHGLQRDITFDGAWSNFLCDAQTRHEDSAEVARVHHVAGQFG